MFCSYGPHTPPAYSTKVRRPEPNVLQEHLLCIFIPELCYSTLAVWNFLQGFLQQTRSFKVSCMKICCWGNVS